MTEPRTKATGSARTDEPDDENVVSGRDLDLLVRLAANGADVASEAGLERLLGALRTEGRLDAHVDRVAELLDLDRGAAKALLDGAGLPASYGPSPFEGVGLYHVAGGPAVAGKITGFVRIVGGGAFPSHEHLGVETIFLVQGSCVVEETGVVLRAGDTLVATADDRHATVARPGPDLVYLAVVEGGIKVGDLTFLPDDPRI